MKTKSKKPKLLYAYCWQTGRIGFGKSIPKGAIPIAKGKPSALRKAVRVIARESYPSKPGGKDTCLLVPGIPEADNENSRLEALFRFRTEVARRLLPVIRISIEGMLATGKTCLAHHLTEYLRGKGHSVALHDQVAMQRLDRRAAETFTEPRFIEIVVQPS